MSDETISPPLRRMAQARVLSAGAGKSNRGAPGYSRWINRPAGRQLAIIAFGVGLSPNQVTLLSGLTSLAGILVLALAPATVLIGCTVAFLLALAYALDSADGQVARMQGGGSRTGEWLDHVIDCVKIAALHAAVLVCWYRSFDVSDATLLVPIVFGIQASTYFFSKILTDQLRAAAAAPVEAAPPGADEGRPPVLASLLVLPLDYGLLCLTFVLLGFHQLFVLAYSALALLGVLLLAAGFAKWYRDLSRVA
ncbi:CDP-alcohol phosphatidyltransferase [Pedococcus dokdonensis]|uniref:CDP-alcohol phosphatidyltransferase n=1 Tax=Pedococcus dokdonensis TaxID=443156 RepID=A0A1H0S8E8_9MICO|nr:CDP-alcohol phosphatidyltransferase family protein [Pedococcus dokdonensis]SDP37769.1 CDP-alcohol phosphatidyltransferase [Pedococcus dokdonensis]